MAITELSSVFSLTGPDGTKVVFNDPDDPNYVGVLTEITGLDSPEIRESSDDLVEFDGGIHGDFFYGRRPITLSGILLNPSNKIDLNARQNSLSRASDAMRGDAVLAWANTGSYGQQIKVRRQQPLRISGGWQKEFQIQLVAEDPRIYSSVIHSVVAATAPSSSTGGRSYPKTYPMSYSYSLPLGQTIVNNVGSTTTYPSIEIHGPGNNPVVSNFTTGQSIRLIYSLAAGDWLTLDMLNHTVQLNGSSSRYSAVDFVASEWWGLVPGDNDLRIAFDTYLPGSSLGVWWRHADM